MYDGGNRRSLLKMKVAQEYNRQRPVTASASAPNTAICPNCGGVVVLRRRKRMNNGGYAFFWRHQNNRNRSCHYRSRPILL